MESKYCCLPAYLTRVDEPPPPQPSPLSNPVTRFALQAMLTGNTGVSLCGSGPIAAQLLDTYDRMGVAYPSLDLKLA